MIALESVRKVFAGGEGLRETTLTLRPGERMALVGPSGCGKSTLLRLVIGLLRPDAGRVVIDGAEMTHTSCLGLRRAMGYVIQDGGLFPHLTAAANASLMARHLGWPAARVAARLDELTTLVRLPAGALGRYPAQLSGGQRQRVGLMRALMLDPSILLLDEPMGALDPVVRAGLQDDLRRIFGELGKTVLLVTHDMPEAALLAGQIALMQAGRVLQRGSLRDLLERPADPSVSAFLSAHRSLEQIAALTEARA